jgi:ATP-dependent Clp protease ATP-binding subunit ClpC
MTMKKKTKKKKKKKTAESFEKYTTNLNEEALKGKFDPTVGRRKELKRVIQILARRRKNNPILIGEPGVGKTAVAERLAQLIVEGKIPQFLASKKIFSINLGALLSGTKYRGSFETRIKLILKKVKKSPEIILFIDEIHNIFGAGGTVNAGNLLKPALARGGLQCIGATTKEEYKDYIETDLALARRFQPVKIPEATINETIKILRGLKISYENHHRVKITNGACVAAAKLSSQYIRDRFLPDKAIDLIDEACSLVRLRKKKVPEIIKSRDKELDDLIAKKTLAISAQNFIAASDFYAREVAIRKDINLLLRVQDRMEGSDEASIYARILEVQKFDVEMVVTALTGIPVGTMSESEIVGLANLEKYLEERVLCQPNAIATVAKAIRRARVGLKNKNRPVASFIFAGPTGVGKTELTKALALAFLKSENSMIRFDMSEYTDVTCINKLIGAPPGYVGYEKGGILTEKIRQEPHMLVLFDEIEKAHPDIMNLLLQVLDDGRLTDSKGSLVDFKNTFIILTSNIGSNSIQKALLKDKIPLAPEYLDRTKVIKKLEIEVNSDLKQFFKPEFLNRLDGIVIFAPLTEQCVLELTNILLENLVNRVKPLGIILTITIGVRNKLSTEGYQPLYGARPLARVITSYLEDPLTDVLLDPLFRKGTHIQFALTLTREIMLKYIGETQQKEKKTKK